MIAMKRTLQTQPTAVAREFLDHRATPIISLFSYSKSYGSHGQCSTILQSISPPFPTYEGPNALGQFPCRGTGQIVRYWTEVTRSLRRAGRTYLVIAPFRPSGKNPPFVASAPRYTMFNTSRVLRPKATLFASVGMMFAAPFTTSP